ncbi:MAG: hypothetical protein K2M48_03945, partial [Clostridiales bacterium]|nr:hypothetical protein [Clostridiales bacterium]
GSENARASGEGDGESGNAVLDIMINMLGDVLTKENIDVERLSEYDDEANDTYIFELKDKGLAAFANAVLDAMLGKASDIGFLSGANEYVPLKKTVKLKQIKYVVQAKTDEQGVKTAATAADITVWLGLQDAAGYALKKLLNDVGVGWAGGFAAWLGDVILPENVYVTVTVPFEDGAEPKINFNTMNGAERKQMYKLVNGVFKNIMSSDMTVDSLLTDYVDTVRPFISQVADMMDFSEAKGGTISVDLIGAVAKKVSDSSFKDDPLEKKDLMYVLQALLTTTPEAKMHDIEQYLYRDWYADADGSNPIYKYDDSTVVTGKTRIDYGRKFIDEIEEVYALDFGEDADVSQVLEMLGISFGKDLSVSVDAQALLSKIDKAKLSASLDPKNPIRKLRLTDRMLAAALSSKVDTALGDTLKDISVDLEALTFVKHKDEENRTFALLAAEIGIEDLLSSLKGNAAFDLISGLLPKSIMLSIEADITTNLGAGQTHLPTEFVINDYDKTQHIIDTLRKFMPDLDLATLTDDVARMLREMISKLDEALGIELVRSDYTAPPVVSGELVMPDLYTMVVETMLTPEGESKGVVTNEQLRSVMYGLNNTKAFADYDAAGDKTDDTPKGFIDQIIDMYYLDLDPESEPKFEDLTKFLTGNENDTDKEFGEKFRVKGTTVGVKYLAYDPRTIEEITPVMTAAQLGAIIKQEMNGMDDIKDVFSLLDVKISATSISVIMQADVSKLVPEDVLDMMSVNKLYVTATVDVSQVVDGAYPVEFTVNSMSSADRANLVKILNFLDGSINIESKTADFGRIVYEQLGELRDSLGNDDFVRFTNRGIEIASFYEFLSFKLGIGSNDPEKTNVEWAQTVKNVVQGMYERPKNEAGEYIDEIYEGAPDDKIKNYRESDLIVNAPKAGVTTTYIATKVAKGDPIYDKEFNAWFQEVLDGNDVVALQTIALAANDSGEDARKVREWLNGYTTGNPATLDTDHVVVSFRLPMDKFSAEDDKKENTDKAYGFLPKFMCATIILDMEADGSGNDKFTCVGTIVNNLNAEEYDLFVRLMGLSPDSTSEGKV